MLKRYGVAPRQPEAIKRGIGLSQLLDGRALTRSLQPRHADADRNDTERSALARNLQRRNGLMNRIRGIHSDNSMTNASPS